MSLVNDLADVLNATLAVSPNARRQQASKIYDFLSLVIRSPDVPVKLADVLAVIDDYSGVFRRMYQRRLECLKRTLRLLVHINALDVSQMLYLVSSHIIDGDLSGGRSCSAMNTLIYHCELDYLVKF